MSDHGIPRKQAAALSIRELKKLVDYLEAQQGLAAIRDRALLLLGYFGAFRRSELVSLTWEQVQFESQGIVVEIYRSKTDQEGSGQRCVIPVGSKGLCAAQTLLKWRGESKCYEGKVFRRFSPKGTIQEQGIGDHHFNRMIQKLAQQAGCLDADDMSAHSLRRGFATEAARKGASMPAIQKHGRWKSTQTVLEYIEAGREFKDSAVNVLFEE